MKSLAVAAFLLVAIPRLDTGWQYAVTDPRATPPDERIASASASMLRRRGDSRPV